MERVERAAGPWNAVEWNELLVPWSGIDLRSTPLIPRPSLASNKALGKLCYTAD